ncbi:MAG: alanine/ornithine racemase family PLP-dependent enzyme [Sulfitobacter sp.]
MKTPRMEVDLYKIRHNARTLVGRLASLGISVSGVTKSVCGHPDIARAMLDGGVVGLADARINNVQRLRCAGITAPIAMIRTPMMGQVEQVVRTCNTSYNTERSVILSLATAAVRQHTVHNIILMVEMGDMRDGIRPEETADIARQIVSMKGLALRGIGANFACLNNSPPTGANMIALSSLADEVEGKCGPLVDVVSGGNSASLPWAFAARPKGRVNNLRIGEAILLGVEPISGDQIDGLYTDAFSFVAEIIEKKLKPESVTLTSPSLAGLRLARQSEPTEHLILAIGQQDTDTLGLSMPLGVKYVGATSDHLVLQMARPTQDVGRELKFRLNYSALMRAMAAPDITIKLLNQAPRPKVNPPKHSHPNLALV